MSEINESNPTNGNEMSAGEPLEAPLITPAVEKQGTPWGPIVGGIAVAGALLGGVWFAASGNDEVDVASVDPSEEVAEESTDEDGSDSDTDATASEGALFEEEAMEDEEALEDFATAAADSVFGGSSSSPAVWDGEQFIRLNMNGAGWTASTSTDGLNWVETPATGLPDEGYVYGLVEEDGVLAGIVDEYDERGSRQSLVTSTNGTDWTAVVLPNSDEGDSNYSGIALLNGQVIGIRTTYDNSGDPYQILMDAGILTGELQESFCGFDYDYENEGGPIDLLTCNYEENEENYPTDEELDALAARYDAAETDEERRAIEEELDELWGNGDTEVFATINPGDPVYDALSETLFGEFEGGGETIEVVSGPLSGPFDVSAPFDQSGYASGIVQTDSALFVSFENYDERTGSSSAVILTSTDGASWTEVGAPPASQGGSLQGFGDALFYMSYDETGGSSSYISTDGASTWTLSTLETSLFETYSQFSAGEAGIVALTNGLLEPYSFEEPEFRGPEVSPVIEKDGFTLDLGYFDGTLTLTGPDGLVISLSEEEVYDGDGTAVRMNPINGATTFLDPDTGEDLITFTDADYQAAYEAFDSEFYEEEVYEEPARGVEVHFSTDGVTWTELDSSVLDTTDPNSFVGFTGVGDDEAAFFIETYNNIEPSPDLFLFEEEGREPTDAELEALQLWEQGSSSTEYVRIPLG